MFSEGVLGLRASPLDMHFNSEWGTKADELPTSFTYCVCKSSSGDTR